MMGTTGADTSSPPLAAASFLGSGVIDLTSDTEELNLEASEATMLPPSRSNMAGGTNSFGLTQNMNLNEMDGSIFCIVVVVVAAAVVVVLVVVEKVAVAVVVCVAEAFS